MLEAIAIYVDNVRVFAEGDYVQTAIDVVEFASPPRSGHVLRAYKSAHSGIAMACKPVLADGVTRAFQFSDWQAHYGVTREPS